MKYRFLIAIVLLIGLYPRYVFSETQNNNVIECGMTKDAVDKIYPNSWGVHEFSLPLGTDMYHCYLHYVQGYRSYFFFIYKADSLYSIINTSRILKYHDEAIQSGPNKGDTTSTRDDYDPVKLAEEAIRLAPMNINDFQQCIAAGPQHASGNIDLGLTLAYYGVEAAYYAVKFITYPFSLIRPDQSLKERMQYLKNYLFDKSWLGMDY